jgi:hypothetical protein
MFGLIAALLELRDDALDVRDSLVTCFERRRDDLAVNHVVSRIEGKFHNMEGHGDLPSDARWRPVPSSMSER